MSSPKISVVLGTRPEVIKLAPVIRVLRRTTPTGAHVSLEVVHQQGEILDDALEEWGLCADWDLRLTEACPSHVAALRAMSAPIAERLARVAPDLVIVHGDTNTAAAAALAARRQHYPVAHVEAGLRSGNLDDPFPEERNRRLIDRIAQLHYAPTGGALRNLLAEGLVVGAAPVVGNTVVDAIAIAARAAPQSGVPDGLRTLLVTAHRRESYGAGVRSICTAIRRLVERRDDLRVVYVQHPNPCAHGPVHEMLDGVRRVELLPPQTYANFIRQIRDCDAILTDSGGIQEEAPLFGKPVLVTRECTERPEGLRAGVARMVGREASVIVDTVSRLFDDPTLYASMARRCSPYGPPGAAQAIATDVAHRLRRALAS